ncbi:hypothetical protein [Agrobacterium larrymoorei]|uniref:Uncharacterized protein n=1 Tax=Agrobacterium larrymoorei TaxID=160699 RepID=A0AAF0HFZ6_9HYPH|nr:hypothetical protein [Agrobacterium larrymoorei]WHA44055.1 hypothetical protein CFBP5477_021810 [Agrobacterium larrymoorei]
MEIPSNLNSLLSEINIFLKNNNENDISKYLSQSKSLKVIDQPKDVKAKDMRFWKVRLEIIESNGFKAPGLRDFTKKIKESMQKKIYAKLYC